LIYLNFWKQDFPNQSAFFHNLARKHSFDPIEDAHCWYNITKKDILNCEGGATLLNQYRGSHTRALLAFYPQALTASTLSGPIQRQQKNFQKTVEDLLSPSSQAMYINARKESGMVKYTNGVKTYHELDIWIPGLNLGYEYQDKHHYVTTWYANETLAEYSAKDSVKKSAMQAMGRSLVVIPCWWDGQPESIIATTRQVRPDVFQEYALVTNAPVSMHPPIGFFSESHIPGVGQIMLASYFPRLKFDPGQWWMGEKFDGMRTCWVPSVQTLYSRTGLPVQVQSSFLPIMPLAYLDGELWLGRNSCNKISNLLHSIQHSRCPPWNCLRYIVFDVPSYTYQKAPFETRYRVALLSIQKIHPFIVPTVRIRCSGMKHVNSYTEAIIANRGEGTMLRRPTSVYECGRSYSIFKYKVIHKCDQHL
jgi:hypothetical protein